MRFYRKITYILIFLFLHLVFLSGQSAIKIKLSDGTLHTIRMEPVSYLLFPHDSYNKIYVYFLDNSRSQYLLPELIWFEGGLTSHRDIAVSNPEIIYQSGKLKISNINLFNTNKIYIYDVFGRLINTYILENNQNNVKIDISFLQKGIYLVKAGKFTKKIII